MAACALRALVLYALGEYQSGHASTLRVEWDGASFSVADDGRGHAVNRSVGAAPYLPFIYNHLDYPFASDPAAPVQLQGNGMSLINALCSQLSVVARRREATLRLHFEHGQLRSQEVLALPSEQTGNTISGVVRPEFCGPTPDTDGLRKWLLGLTAAHAPLKLLFNGTLL